MQSRTAQWPLFFSFGLLAALLVYLYAEILKSCGGHFGYPMDDTYIHMAMARAFSSHGTWGLTRYAFSSTSSSLLFTALLSGIYLVTGTHELAPFLVNALLGFVLLPVMDGMLRSARIDALARAGYLTLMVFGMPLAPEIIAGMEHVLHTLITLVFVFYAVRLLLNETVSPQLIYLVPVLGALIVLARYEALALVAVTAILFFLRGRRWFAIALFAASVVPVAVFGVYSVRQGWFPVPNSIIAKASRPEKSQVPYPVHWVEQLVATPAVLFLFLAGAILLVVCWRRRGFWNFESVSLALFLATTLLHMQFARVGWFYRYEAYLVAFGIYACALGLKSLDSLADWAIHPSRRQLAYGTFTLLAAGCFESRAVGALWLTPWAARNIYEQQYQMGRFLRQSYAGRSVLLNDIGAAAYLSDARIVDLYGLATIAVARAKVHHAFTREFRRSLARETDSKIAILFPEMYRNVGGLPPEWIRVGTWQIAQNQICWGDTIAFYAVDPAYKEQLIADLRRFSPQLPRDVVQAGEYTGTTTKPE